MKKGALVLDDERLLRAAASKSLREFVRQAVNIVVPAEPFMASWHTDSIFDHLEALRRREIRNLLITMPPRHLKSTIVSVLFPPWCWLHDPTERFLTASYAADLATRDAVASRTLIESSWFQRWSVRIDQTQNRQDRFSNTQRGYRLVTSVGGSTTGEGGDILVAVVDVGRRGFDRVNQLALAVDPEVAFHAEVPLPALRKSRIPIGVIKRVFGFTKVRYRGLLKNRHRLVVAAALANLFMVRKCLLRLQEA